MNRIFVCADLHFGHKNIIAYENRPFASVEEMNERLIENWNAVVDPDDIVYVLGDVGFCGNTKLSEWISRLNGHKHLIRGNHDLGRSLDKWCRLGFESACEEMTIHYACSNERICMTHMPPQTIKPGCFYLYGHVHSSPDYPDHTDSTACVSIERLGYAPALLEDVISGKAYERT